MFESQRRKYEKEISDLQNNLDDLRYIIRCNNVDKDSLINEINNLKKEIEDLNIEKENLLNTGKEYQYSYQKQSNFNSELLKSVSDCDQKITELQNQLNEQKEVNEKYIQDYRDVTGQNKIYKEAYMNLKNQMDQEIELANKLTNENIEKDNIIASQEAAIKGIIYKEFDKDHIEYAALKTYRGWEYVYYNGKFLSIKDAKSINVYYDQCDPLRINIDT